LDFEAKGNARSNFGVSITIVILNLENKFNMKNMFKDARNLLSVKIITLSLLGFFTSKIMFDCFSINTFIKAFYSHHLTFVRKARTALTKWSFVQKAFWGQSYRRQFV